MVMWRVTVKPEENKNAWRTFVEQSIIGIGWPSRSYDSDPAVRRFSEINVGDWIVAHVPASHSGAPCLAKGVGQVVSSYREVKKVDLPIGDEWSGDFRRQLGVKWNIDDQSLRGILSAYRGTVIKVSESQELQILNMYGL